MSIHTRFGSEVKLNSPVDPDGWVTVHYLDRQEVREVHVSDLRAEDGAKEIYEESDKFEAGSRLP
jgi:hypothetical protein